MEIRTLKYFLTIAREENISNAAKYLHITQPTLSRQMKELEDSFNKTLFIRGSRKILLTEEGMLLRKRAEEILSLVEKTEAEILNADNDIKGTIYIGAAEADSIRPIIKIMKDIKQEYPNINYNFSSGNASDVCSKLDNGLIDFGILLDSNKIDKYNYLKIPTTIKWGLLTRKDNSIAKKTSITLKDIENIPLIVSAQHAEENSKNSIYYGKLKNIVASYNLIYNAALMVDEGLGSAICIDKLVSTDKENNLTFIPFKDSIEVDMYIFWKKNQIFSKPSEHFLKILQAKYN